MKLTKEQAKAFLDDDMTIADISEFDYVTDEKTDYGDGSGDGYYQLIIKHIPTEKYLRLQELIYGSNEDGWNFLNFKGELKEVKKVEKVIEVWENV